MARKYKLPDTEVHITSLPDSVGHFSHIEYRSYEGIVTAGIIRAARAAAREGFDALAIGCFYDTGLAEAREVSGDMIVTAPCVASCEIAASLSNRFGVIVGRRKWVDQMQSTVHTLGHRDRLSGFYHVELGVTEFQEDHDRTQRCLLDAGRRAVEQDYAEALILGCTMEVGFYSQVEECLGVPVIDPSIAALKRAEYGAILKRDCGWTPSRKWSCESPPELEMIQIGAFDTDTPFGGRIVIPAIVRKI
ncbi:MAG: aspartate/glutamate racemase family protein [Rhodospirillales bacterium]